MKALLIILVIVAVIALPLLFFMFYGMGSIRKLIIQEIDLSKISDGTYHGSYHKGRWTFDLEITVQNHRIVSVKNTNKRMEMFQEFNAKLTSTLLEKQQIPLDTVSGATIHTKAFCKAVENTLTDSK